MSIMDRQLPKPLFLSALFLAAGVALSACDREQVAAPEPVRPVKVLKAEFKSNTRDVIYSGSVKARREANLGFRVGGKIVERLVNVGERVSEGAVLARLDRSDLQLALTSAEAALGAAQSQLVVAQSAYDRAAGLSAKGFATQATLDDRRLALDQAKSAVDQARSSRDTAAHQADYGELKSDVAGVVTSVLAESGQVVAAGAAVVMVARDGEKEVAVAVPESEIRFFHVGDRFSVRFWADPGLVRTGVAREIAGSADATSRTFAVRVSLPDDPAIRLGETATVEAKIPVEATGIDVPLSAMTQHDGRTSLWIVDPRTKTVASRDVQTAGFAEEGIRIVSGLQPGELVVTAGTQFMTPGKSVLLAASGAPDVSAEASMASVR